MGHTLGEWTAKVSKLIRDVAGKDVSVDLEDVGLRPALAQFSTDRPYELVVEAPGVGSSYFDMPEGWVEGVSHLSGVEFPARRNPPEPLDGQSWTTVRDPTDTTSKQILLRDHVPVAGQFVWFTFSAPWPYPTNDVDDDTISAIGFEAVAALAASFCLTGLAAEAARGYAASFPTNLVDGTQRAATLMEAAKRYEGVYNRFLGLASTSGAGQAAASSSPPAHGRYDLDPSFASLFHGGRR